MDAIIAFERSGGQPWPGTADLFTTRSLVLAAKELDALIRSKGVLPFSTFLREEMPSDHEREEMGMPPRTNEWFDCREGLRTVDALIAVFEWLGPDTELAPGETFAGGPVEGVVSDLRAARKSSKPAW